MSANKSACYAILAPDWLRGLGLKACACRYGLVKRGCQLASHWMNVVVSYLVGLERVSAGFSLVESVFSGSIMISPCLFKFNNDFLSLNHNITMVMQVQS